MSSPELTLRPLPENVEHELSAATFDNPPWGPDDGDGRTLFDTPQSEDGTVLVVFPQARFERWRAQALAHVESRADGRTYLAQVVRGPYAAPIGLPANAPALVVAQVENALFTPPYHGWAALAILGEVRDGRRHVPLYRPRPNSRVVLDCDGDLRLGQAVGQPDLKLAQVLDLAEAAAALAAGEEGVDDRYLHDDGASGRTASRYCGRRRR